MFVGDIKWIKLSVDLFANRKIRQIEHLPRGDTLILIWIKLLILAGQINDGGMVYITPELGYTIDSLAAEFGRPKELVQQAMELFARFGMTETDPKGIVTICGWERHQNVEGMERVREQTRKRVQRHREKKALERCNVTETRCNPPEEETEAEEESEEDTDFLSFTHTREEDEVYLPNEQRKRMGGALGRNVVFLSDAQMEDLLERLSLDEFDYYVSLVAENELAGKHYTKKTHYQAILDMVKADRKVKRRND